MREPAYYIGKPVESLQTMLRIVSAQNDEIPSVIPDGIYGARTMQAVKAFQKCHCLPTTGITDHDTWRAVVAAFEDARVERAPAEPLFISLSPNETIAPDSSSPYVLLLQAMLHTLAAQFENLTDCSLCGSYDDATEAAVRAIQKAAGLPETGIADKQFWRMLTGFYTQVTGTNQMSCNSDHMAIHQTQTRSTDDLSAHSSAKTEAPLPWTENLSAANGQSPHTEEI